MNLIEFTQYLKSEDRAMEFIKHHYPTIDYYDAEVYLKGSISADSEVILFDGQKINGLIEMEFEGELYYNLFTLDLLVEVYGDFSNPPGIDDEIAARIIKYRIKNA